VTQSRAYSGRNEHRRRAVDRRRFSWRKFLAPYVFPATLQPQPRRGGRAFGLWPVAGSAFQHHAQRPGFRLPRVPPTPCPARRPCSRAWGIRCRRGLEHRPSWPAVAAPRRTPGEHYAPRTGERVRVRVARPTALRGAPEGKTGLSCAQGWNRLPRIAQEPRTATPTACESGGIVRSRPSSSPLAGSQKLRARGVTPAGEH
jgi:hypothetical protein